jgi:Universal stress protein family
MGEPVIDVVHERPGEGSIHARRPGAPRRVLAVFEPCAAGDATLREAAELAAAGSELSVVTLAPQALPPRCCSKGGVGPYNIAVREEAKIELRQARDKLGSTAPRASFTVLVGHPDPPLVAWVNEHAPDVVLLPNHPFTRGGNRYARALRRATRAEIRVVV